MSLKKLSSRHHAIMRRLVLGGYTQKEAAQEFDISESRLSVLRHDPLWIDEEQRMRKDAYGSHKAELEGLRGKAIDALAECVESDYQPVKLKSATDILDRTGLIGGLKVDMDVKPTIKLYIPPGWKKSG